MIWMLVVSRGNIRPYIAYIPSGGQRVCRGNEIKVFYSLWSVMTRHRKPLGEQHCPCIQIIYILAPEGIKGPLLAAIPNCQ